MSHVALEWASIFAAIALCEAFWHPLLYVAAVVWIGARQQALFILNHEGVHHLILRDRWWNDWVSRLLLAWPVGVPFDAYRATHLFHHRDLNTQGDPDWARNRPDRLRDCGDWWSFLKVMSGLGMGPREVFSGRETGPAPSRRPQLLFYGAVLVVAAVFGLLGELAMYWLVPLGTMFLFLMRLNGTAQHFAVEDEEPCNSTRTMLPTWPERLLLVPKNFQYHIEHHIYPSVPFHRLDELHSELMGIEHYREHAHLTRTYPHFFLECARFAGLVGNGSPQGEGERQA